MRLLVLLLYLLECHSFKSSLKEPKSGGNVTTSWRPLSAKQVSAIHSTVQSANRRNEFFWAYDPRPKRQQLEALKGIDQQIEVPLQVVQEPEQEHNVFLVIEEELRKQTTTENEVEVLTSRKELIADSGSK